MLFPFHSRDGRCLSPSPPGFQAQGLHVAVLILPAGVEYTAVRKLKSHLVVYHLFGINI